MPKRRLFPLIAATSLVLGCSGVLSNKQDSTSLAAKSLDRPWSEESIYFVLTDRFYDGDRNNNYNVNTSKAATYHGGDLQGVIDKLDYIKDLGMTTIWITPVVDNDDDQLAQTGMWGYHGYWAKDFTKVDEHLGTMDKLKELITKAHQKGIKVLIDIVANHAGYSYPANDHPTWIHHNGNIQNWENPWQVENCSIYGLPDFAQENPEASQYLIGVYKDWIKTGADGYRVDTVKHVPLSFWTTFNQALHQAGGKSFFLLGEMLHGDANTVAKYQSTGGFDSLFDYPLYYKIKEVFAYDGSMRKLGSQFALDGTYQNAMQMSPFIDNHDLPRFLHVANGNEAKLKLATAFIATIRGIPCIYMGTEVGMTGGDDPENRKDMAWNTNKTMLEYTRKLFTLRQSSAALRGGIQLEMWQDDKIYAFARKKGTDEAVVVLNNNTQTETREIPLRTESTLKDGTVLEDRLNGGTVTVQNRKITVQTAGKTARVFLPR